MDNLQRPHKVKGGEYLAMFQKCFVLIEQLKRDEFISLYSRKTHVIPTITAHSLSTNLLEISAENKKNNPF